MIERVRPDLVLHVVDRSNERWREQMEVAEEVLADLGVEPDRVVTVLNKSDRLASAVNGGDPGGALWVSAVTGDGIDDLKALLSERLEGRLAAGASQVAG